MEAVKTPLLTPTKTKRQLVGLSGLRALAAIGIVFYHLAQHRTTAGLAEWNWDLYKLMELLPLIVSFFFIMGGALHSMPFWRIMFARKPEDTTPISSLVPSVKKTLIDRFFRIAPAYYGALLVTFLVVWILQGIGSNDVLRLFAGLSFLSWIHPLTFFPVEMNGPLWFISYDIVWGLLVLAVMHILVRIPRKASTMNYIFSIVATYGAIIGLLLLGHSWFTSLSFPHLPGIVSEWFPWYNPFVFGLHFMIGTVLGALWTRAEVRDSKPSWWYDGVFFVSVIGLVGFLWEIRFEDIFAIAYPRSPYHFPFTAVGIALILFAVTGTKWIGQHLDNPLTNFLAKISYSLYLWHALVIGLLCRYIFGSAALEDLAWWSFVGVTFLLSVPLAMLSERFIERGAMGWKKKHID